MKPCRKILSCEVKGKNIMLDWKNYAKRDKHETCQSGQCKMLNSTA